MLPHLSAQGLTRRIGTEIHHDGKRLLIQAMLQPQAAFGVDLHLRGGLLSMDATPRRQW